MASQATPPALHGPAFTPETWVPAVLVVDGDHDCIAQCTQMLEDLNYPHRCVSSARDALEQVTRDPAIQIILADMHIAGAGGPSMDGFVLVEEARARVGNERPLAAVMMTREITADLALRGLHVEAADVLCKPLGFDAYSMALRRAMRYLDARRGAPGMPDMTHFGQQIARLVSVLESRGADPAGSELTEREISATLRTMIASRSLRGRFFPAQMFADPAWDILLDLTRARLEGQQVSVSSVCIAASVPMSTALRWVKQMTDAGLLLRWTDPKDRRRDLIALADQTADHMREYLAAVHTMLTKL